MGFLAILTRLNNNDKARGPEPRAVLNAMLKEAVEFEVFYRKHANEYEVKLVALLGAPALANDARWARGSMDDYKNSAARCKEAAWALRYALEHMQE